MPTPTISNAPANSTISTSGPYTAFTRVDASSAARLPCPSAAETLDLGRLAVVGLDELDVREALLHHRAHRTGPATDLPRRGAPQARETPAGDEEERSHGKRKDGQIPPEVEKKPGEDGDPQQVSESRRDAREHDVLDRLDIVGEARDHIAEAAALEEVERQILDMPEDVRAQIENESLADQRREVVVEERGNSSDERQADVRARDPRERPEVVRHQDPVDQILEEQRSRGRDDRSHRDDQQHQQQRAAIGSRERPEATENRPDRKRRRLGDDRRALSPWPQLSQNPAAHRRRRGQADEQRDRGAEQDVKKRPQPRRSICRVQVFETRDSLVGLVRLVPIGSAPGLSVAKVRLRGDRLQAAEQRAGTDSTGRSAAVVRADPRTGRVPPPHRDPPARDRQAA